MSSFWKTSTTFSTQEKYPTFGSLKKRKTLSTTLELSTPNSKDQKHLRPSTVPLWKESDKDYTSSCRWAPLEMRWGSGAENSQDWSTAARSTGFSPGLRKPSSVSLLQSLTNSKDFRPIRPSLKDMMWSKHLPTSARRFISLPTRRQGSSRPH